MISTVLLEIAFWGTPTPGNQFPVSTRIMVLSFVLAPLSGLLIDRFLEAKTPWNAKPPWQLRILRFLFSCIPCVGLFAVPLWGKFLQKAGSRNAAQPFPSLDLARRVEPNGESAIPWKKLRSYLIPISLLLALLQLPLWVLWLTGPFSGAGKNEVFSACLALHLALAACVAIYAYEAAHSDEPIVAVHRKAAWLLPLLLFLPSTLVLLLIVFSIRSQKFADPLISSAYTSRVNARSNPLWARSQELLRTSWRKTPLVARWHMPTGLESATEYVPAQDEVRAFYRWKSLLLAGEAGVITWCLFRFPIAGHAVMAGLPILAWICALLAATGLLIEVLGGLSHLVRAHGFAKFLDNHPYGRSIFYSHGSLLAGVAGGAFAAQGETKNLGWSLILYFSMFVLASGFFFLFSSYLNQGWRESDLVLWVVSLFGMALFYLLVLRPASAPWLRCLMALLPLSAVAYGLARGDRLLYPFSWKDLRDHRLPRNVRRMLTAVAVTAVLPLGTLAIPFWIYARQRLWPRYWSACAALR